MQVERPETTSRSAISNELRRPINTHALTNMAASTKSHTVPSRTCTATSDTRNTFSSESSNNSLTNEINQNEIDFEHDEDEDSNENGREMAPRGSHWSFLEKARFEQALQKHGLFAWRAIIDAVGTRSEKQVKAYAARYRRRKKLAAQAAYEAYRESLNVGGNDDANATDELNMLSASANAIPSSSTTCTTGIDDDIAINNGDNILQSNQIGESNENSNKDSLSSQLTSSKYLHHPMARISFADDDDDDEDEDDDDDEEEQNRKNLSMKELERKLKEEQLHNDNNNILEGRSSLSIDSNYRYRFGSQNHQYPEQFKQQKNNEPCDERISATFSTCSSSLLSASGDRISSERRPSTQSSHSPYASNNNCDNNVNNRHTITYSALQNHRNFLKKQLCKTEARVSVDETNEDEKINDSRPSMDLSWSADNHTFPEHSVIPPLHISKSGNSPSPSPVPMLLQNQPPTRVHSRSNYQKYQQQKRQEQMQRQQRQHQIQQLRHLQQLYQMQQMQEQQQQLQRRQMNQQQQQLQQQDMNMTGSNSNNSSRPVSPLSNGHGINSKAFNRMDTASPIPQNYTNDFNLRNSNNNPSTLSAHVSEGVLEDGILFGDDMDLAQSNSEIMEQSGSIDIGLPTFNSDAPNSTSSCDEPFIFNFQQM